MPPAAEPVSVLVDARPILASGIGRYLRECLVRLLRDPRCSRVVLLGDPAQCREFVAGAGAAVPVEYVPLPAVFYSPRVQLEWLRLRARGRARADVSLFPHYDAPAFAFPRSSLVTVHDLTHFKLPEVFPGWRRHAAGLLLDRVTSSAARIVVNSERTRRDLEERNPRLAAKIVVVPFGVSEFFQAPGGGGAVVAQWQPYLLCVGNRKPHKNFVVAVEALARLRQTRPTLRLVVAGQRFPEWREVLTRARQLGVETAIVDLGSVGDELLRDLYAHSEAFLFPSLYEGFGLPVLEAMAAGAPVIATNRASVPEVVGDAGILVDPNDPDGIAAAVQRLHTDAALRARLTTLGRERVQHFTWERAGQRVVDLLIETAVRFRREPAPAPTESRTE